MFHNLINKIDLVHGLQYRSPILFSELQDKATRSVKYPFLGELELTMPITSHANDEPILKLNSLIFFPSLQ